MHPRDLRPRPGPEDHPDDPIVLGGDISTSAVKVIARTARGVPLAQARRPLETRHPGPRRFEQDPEHWWQALVDCLRELATNIPMASVAALALAHQRETIVAVDDHGATAVPAMLWLDGRGEAWIDAVRRGIDDATLRAITGKTPNYGLSLYKIAWLRDQDPVGFRNTRYFLDIGAYLAGRLTGRYVTSDTAADPTGLFDIHRRRWSATLCGRVGIAADRLPATVPPGALIGPVSETAALATGLPAGTPLIAAGGDGQTAGLGVAATHAGRGYLNLGTAVVGGVYSEHPVTDHNWRTLCAGGARGYYLESSLRSGALLSDWFLRRLADINPAADSSRRQTLEAEAATRPPGSHGLLLLPYWQGAMDPHWDERASGALLGMTVDHDRAAMYRALIEGVALEQARFLEAVRQRTGSRVDEIAVMGGLATSDLWCRIMADVLAVRIVRSASVEAAAEGAAMCAAAGAGLHADPETATRAMTAADTAVFDPAAEHAGRYRELRAIHADLYGSLRDLLHRLDRFRHGG